MKIKRKDVLEWVRNKTPVRYRGEIYHARYNGLRYYLEHKENRNIINFYGMTNSNLGLESNKKHN